MSTREHADVLVLGAGIQGACTALALAEHGWQVDVVDAADGCLTRASLRNEGKIHLGFVYANDGTGQTPTLMLDAALQFGDLLDQWCGHPLPWAQLRSRPFSYVVRTDSMCSADALFEKYAALQADYDAYGNARYVGTTPGQLWMPSEGDTCEDSLNPDLVESVAATAEVALDTALLRNEIRAALESHPRIRTRYHHTVRGAARTTTGFEIDGTRTDGSTWRAEAPVAVNCLWEQRIAMDEQLGIAATRPWVLRLKYRVLGTLPSRLAHLPSMTFVLGRFGDIVVNPHRLTYLSWYPSCLAGWQSQAAPAEWAVPCRGHDPTPEAAARAREAVRNLAEMVPGLHDFETDTVDAGIIAAWGSTDIDDPQSDLHERFDIGVHEHDGWISIDTGKLTTAPLFAKQVGEILGPR